MPGALTYNSFCSFLSSGFRKSSEVVQSSVVHQSAPLCCQCTSFMPQQAAVLLASYRDCCDDLPRCCCVTWQNERVYSVVIFAVLRCRLTGSISPYCGSTSNLVNVFLGNNSLRGTIPGNLTSNSQMLMLELYGNKGLSGTMPDTKS
jgi:hypothetical protein